MRPLRLIVPLSLCIALACGGDGSGGTVSEDRSERFIGGWVGLLGVTVGSEVSPPRATTIEIIRRAPNELLIAGLCAKDIAIPASVIDQSTLTTGVFLCPPAPERGCESVSADFSTGGGLVANGYLSLSFSGTMHRCGDSTPVELQFTGRPTLIPPTVARVEPNAVMVGGPSFTLTVIGTRFESSATIHWNGYPFPTRFLSETQLSATIPATQLTESGSADVTVWNSDKSVSAPVPVEVRNPRPVLISLSPAQALVGTSELVLAITGENFSTKSIARWKGDNRPTRFLSNDRLEMTLGAEDLFATSGGIVTVLNPAPGGGVSSPLTLQIDNPPPTLEEIFPVSVVAGTPGLTLTVSGSGFVGPTVVRWNGTSLPTDVVSPTLLRALVEQADLTTAGTVEISVYTPPPGGGATGTVSFTIAEAQGP